ncbi:hypothetical protein [Mycobacteroides abscessus]|uniref:hypothetical protein n=1 Tax=Mycobacteroides abscessus TaxID=36809 RepID=UPI00113A20F7|nr:hypothetical protein [Mycobacteroides abscessus]TKV35334.1 hypothetical protein CFA71_24000 [Mycobacteroides abscessus subsp. bolletii]
MGGRDQLHERFQAAVTRAETAGADYLSRPDSTRRFIRTSRRLDAALTLGLQLVGAEHTPGPAIVAQLRAQYG